MKNFVIVLVLFNILLSADSYSQNDTLVPGFANIATLIVNYETYQFEGGDLAYYLCTTCNNDSLPFSTDYNLPGDFGDITFNISPTNDTIFTATIIWMGTGQIQYPNSFSTTPPFSISGTVVDKPLDITYWNTNGQVTTDSVLINKADSAWHEIEALEITDMFSKLSFKVGIYLYPPTVGMFNPAVAKWVIFLYTDIEIVSIQDFISKTNKLCLYPNPTANIIRINQDLLNEDVRFYTIINHFGAKLLQGEISNTNSEIDLSSFPSGIYYLELFNSNMIRIKVESVIKR